MADEIEPRLYGLVLAGGRGTRLGADKGALDYHGQPQAQWLYRLVEPFCTSTYISIRNDQADQAPYRDLPQLLDERAGLGPAGALATAVRRVAGAAWLVVAADMPLLDKATLATLVANRDPLLLGTAFRHPDSTPEPLCAIWEPAVAVKLTEGQSAPESVSLRRLLAEGHARLIEPPNADALRSVNTAADDAFVRAALKALGAVGRGGGGGSERSPGLRWISE